MLRRRRLVPADLRRAPRHLDVVVGLPPRRAEDHRLEGGESAASRELLPKVCARDVAGDPEADIEDAQQLWYVCQTTERPNGECVVVEQRHFVASIPTGILTRDQELALVRVHWATENRCHRTMDVMLGEDDGQPCQASGESIETVSRLRIIGYNTVSARRQQSPRRDRKPVAWKRAQTD